MSDFLEPYKPYVNLGTTFNVDESLPEKDQAFDAFKKLVTARKAEDVVFLSIGKLLKLVRDKKLYKYLDYENFSQFLSSEELSFSREKAYMCIRIYEHYSEFLELDEDVMRDFSIVRLSLMIPTLKKIPDKEDQLKKLEEMKALRYNDFVMEAKRGSDNDKPTVYFSQELDKWIIKYWNDKTQLIPLGDFKEKEVEK